MRRRSPRTAVLAGIACACILLLAVPDAPAAAAARPLPAPRARTLQGLASAASGVLGSEWARPYLQPSSTRYLYRGQAPVAQWPALAIDAVVQAAAWNESAALLLSAYSLALLRADTGALLNVTVSGDGLPLGSTARIAVSPDGSEIAIGNGATVCRCDASAMPSLTCAASAVPAAPVRALAYVDAAPSLWVGTDAGLFEIPPGASPQLVQRVRGQVSAIAAHDGRVSVATPSKMWVCSHGGARSRTPTRTAPVDASKCSWTWDWVATPDGTYDGAVDAPPTATCYDQHGTLWVGNSVCVNAQDAGLAYTQVGALQGLPSGNITSAASANNEVWLGTSSGLIRRPLPFAAGQRDPSRWHFLNGTRYLPSPDVTSVAVLPASGDGSFRVVAACGSGIAVVAMQNMTLEQKANALQSLVYPRHNRYGLVSSCSLASFGNVSEWSPQIGESDGLWTGYYLASQCYRYAVKGDEGVRKAAWAHFEAMEFLHNVTGIPGYVARTFARSDDPYGGSWWHNSTAYPGWAWQGDTSSDSLSAHMMIYPLVLKHIAKSSAEKERVLRLIRLVTSHIVDNRYRYIGYGGNATTWGHWNPVWLEARDQSAERGVNSVQILSWLLSSHKFTGNDTYLQQYNILADDFAYAYNLINQKITCYQDVNFSDNGNAMLPYLNWILSESSRNQDQFQTGMDRMMATVSSMHSSLWDLIYGLTTPLSALQIQQAAVTLRTWPMELVDWPVDNTARIDVQVSPYPTRSGGQQMRSVLPYDEISYFRWNGNPFDLTPGGSGMTEYDPGAFLFPYWLGRYMAITASSAQ